MNKKKYYSIFVNIVLAITFAFTMQGYCQGGAGYMYLEIDGGTIEGPNADGSFNIFEFSNKFYHPVNDQFQVSDKLYRTLPEVQIELSQASPELFEALINYRIVDQVQFKFLRETQGELEVYYTLTLTNAEINSVNTGYSSNGLDPNRDSETISFWSNEFEWEYIEGGINYQYNFGIGKRAGILKNAELVTMRIVGQNGAPIVGPREDESSEVLLFNGGCLIPYEENNPDDPPSTLNTRTYKPFQVTKLLDQMNPLLLRALCENEVLQDVTFRFYREGSAEEYYRITLFDARVVADSLCIYVDETTPNYGYQYETVYFTFNSIQWLDVDSGIEFHDDVIVSRIISQSPNYSGDFKLRNFPNPFNSSTKIFFSLPKEFEKERINLSIYDLSGRLVKELLNKEVNSPYNFVSWDSRNQYGSLVPSGNYFYRVTAGGQSQTGKLILLK